MTLSSQTNAVQFTSSISYSNEWLSCRDERPHKRRDSPRTMKLCVYGGWRVEDLQKPVGFAVVLKTSVYYVAQAGSN